MSFISDLHLKLVARPWRWASYLNLPNHKEFTGYCLIHATAYD